jgi:hypothetical protein
MCPSVTLTAPRYELPALVALLDTFGTVHCDTADSPGSTTDRHGADPGRGKPTYNGIRCKCVRRVDRQSVRQ